MSTSESGRKRRRHSAEFKAKVVAVCRQPGMSMAAVALSHGLNANLLRRWVVEAQDAKRPALPTPATPTNTTAAQPPAFVALPMPPADPIRIELVRGDVTVRVHWPLSGAAQCAAWLRELL